MNSYELSRAWFDFCFDNPEKISPNHTAIFCFAIEHCNRLGWKTKFGYPTQMAMDAVGIKKHDTYIKYFNQLVEWNFFILIQKSVNQYSSNIISLNTGHPKKGSALGKAITRHRGKHSDSIGESNAESNPESNGSIYKPYNQEPVNNIHIPEFTEFLNYSKTLKPYKPELDFALEAKYNSWVADGWKDGNGNKIKNWKTKIQNTITFLKPSYESKTSNSLDKIDETTNAIISELMGRNDN